MCSVNTNHNSKFLLFKDDDNEEYLIGMKELRLYGDEIVDKESGFFIEFFGSIENGMTYSSSLRYYEDEIFTIPVLENELCRYGDYFVCSKVLVGYAIKPFIIKIGDDYKVNEYFMNEIRGGVNSIKIPVFVNKSDILLYSRDTIYATEFGIPSYNLFTKAILSNMQKLEELVKIQDINNIDKFYFEFMKQFNI